MKYEVGSKDWSDVVSQIRARFSKLTDENLDSLSGSLELLTDKLESVYGMAKDDAEKEYESFKASLHKATKPAKAFVKKEASKWQ